MYILLSISLFPSSTCVINQCFGCFVTENNRKNNNKTKNNSFLFWYTGEYNYHTIKKPLDSFDFQIKLKFRYTIDMEIALARSL